MPSHRSRSASEIAGSISRVSPTCLLLASRRLQGFSATQQQVLDQIEVTAIYTSTEAVLVASRFCSLDTFWCASKLEALTNTRSYAPPRQRSRIPLNVPSAHGE